MLAVVRLCVSAGVLLIAAQGASPSFTTLYSFSGQKDGASPNAVVFGNNGVLYGTTSAGGIAPCSSGLNGCGVVFALHPPTAAGGAWTVSVLYRFTGQKGDGANPLAGPAIGSNGALYGTTFWGGAKSLGAVFEVRPPAAAGGAWSEAALYSFIGGNGLGADGNSPSASLVISSNGGTLFGTTTLGGSAEEAGTVFKLNHLTSGGWEETILHSFLGLDGDGFDPASGLVMGANGALYGTTRSGPGSSGACPNFAGCGTVFQLTPPPAVGGTWTESTVYIFNGSPNDGSGPAGVLAIGSDGTLYGATTYGGSSDYGAVFALKPPAAAGGAWTESVLYSFTRQSSGGAGPNAGVVLGKNGALYGTTGAGTASSGTVFRLAPPAAAGGAWTETTLHTFTGQNGDGANPSGGPVIGSNGALYGTTQYGGTANSGTVFEIMP